MINTRSMMMIVDDTIRRYNHLYTPVIYMLVKAASFYGLVVFFSYLFRIHYIPTTLTSLLVLAPYVFIVGLFVLLYVFIFAAAPGYFFKKIFRDKRLKYINEWYLSSIISIFTLLFIFFIWCLNDGNIVDIATNSLVTLITLLISFTSYKIASKSFNESKLLNLIKLGYLVMVLLVVLIPGYPDLLMNLIGLAKPSAYIYSVNNSRFSKVDIRFVGAEHIVLSPYLQNNKVSKVYVILPRKDIVIFSTIPNSKNMLEFEKLVEKN